MIDNKTIVRNILLSFDLSFYDSGSRRKNDFTFRSIIHANILYVNRLINAVMFLCLYQTYFLQPFDILEQV